MLKSCPTRYPTSGVGTRVIRLTVNQEAVLQEQFNRWPRAPHTADVVLLAAETGLSEADVEVSRYIYVNEYVNIIIEGQGYSNRTSKVKPIYDDILPSLALVPGMVRHQIGSVAERTGSRWTRCSGLALIREALLDLASHFCT